MILVCNFFSMEADESHVTAVSSEEFSSWGLGVGVGELDLWSLIPLLPPNSPSFMNSDIQCQ